MKIKPAPKRLKRTAPISFRLSPEVVKQLEKLSTVTGKNKTEMIEEMIQDAFKDTIKSK